MNKLKCKKCNKPLRKVRDFIKQSGCSYYFKCVNNECTECDNYSKEKTIKC